MHIWHGLETITRPFEAVSVAIGVFDGVHVGHQALIRQAVEDAHAHGRQAVVLTFDRHPAEVFAPHTAPGYLSVPEKRAKMLSALDVDHLVIVRFDACFRELSPETFLHFVLEGILGARAVFVGEDFRFGNNQGGDVAYLQAAQRRLGFELNVLSPILVGGEKASSTRVRQALRAGDLDDAKAVLGYRYLLRGHVVEGQKLGRTIGYPTANLELERTQVVPVDGIYAVWVDVKGQRYKGACSIGMRPTVGGKERTIETFLLDFSGDLYGAMMDLTFVARLRDELKFDTLDSLIAQIERDVAQTRQLLTAPVSQQAQQAQQ